MTVLSVILQQGQTYEKLTLEPKHFLNAEHRVIYEHMKKLYEKNTPIDFETVATELGKKITEIGDVSYLLKIEGYAPSLENIEFYEDNVFKSFRDKRDHEILVTYNKDRSDENRLNLIKDLEINHLIGLRDTRKSTHDMYIEIAQEIAEGKSKLNSGYESGLIDLDKITGGWQRGNLIVLGARPNMGKTALALHAGLTLSENDGVPHVMTYEMSPIDLLKRLISTKGRIDGDVWLQNQFSLDGYKQAIEAIGRLDQKEFEIYEHVRTVREMKAIMRQAIDEKPEKQHMLIIDGLKYIKAEKNYQNKTQEVAEITADLKLMARELDIPIILVSQLNRGVEQREDKRPFMSDLKDSGSIEEDADLIIFLYRDVYYDTETEFPNTVEINISKHRNGGKGIIYAGFTENFGLFSNQTNQKTGGY